MTMPKKIVTNSNMKEEGMSRGGVRKRAGRQPKWKSGKTKAVRMPTALLTVLLAIAHKLDEGGRVSFGDEVKIYPNAEYPTESKIKQAATILYAVLNGGEENAEIFKNEIGRAVKLLEEVGDESAKFPEPNSQDFLIEVNAESWAMRRYKGLERQCMKTYVTRIATTLWAE
jgi:hypothetical protein